MAHNPIPMRPTPLPAAHRLLVLDVLRGFAVFGILVVNMLFFAGPFEWIVDPPWTSWPDRVAEFLITAFASGKFYSIFSMLFGFGFAIQMERAEARGVAGGRIFARRLLVLLAIGVLHAALLWYGDILHLYAILGFLLLLFRGSPIGKIGPAIAVALAIPPALAGLAAIAASVAPHGGHGQTTAIFRTAEALRAYGSGTWDELTRHRIADWRMLDTFAIFFAPSVFAMMLTGLAAARARVVQDLETGRAFFRRALVITIVPGIAGNLFIASMKEAVDDPMEPTMLSALVTLVQAVAVPALAIAYVSALALAVASGTRLVRGLAPVGRMALTNYLLQSVVGTLIFYSYGLGLFGKVGPATTTGIAIVIFALQVAMSAWWMKRFRFGPVEWIWRSLTYGRVQPMR